MTRLEAELAACRRELADVRAQLEEQEELRARVRRAEDLLTRLSQSVASMLTERSAPAPSSGWRGVLERRTRAAETDPTRPRPRELDDLALIEASGLFDGPWYVRRYPEVVEAGLSPALHYLRIGNDEMRDPGPRFNTAKYLRRHPAALQGGQNALVHHLWMRAGARR